MAWTRTQKLALVLVGIVLGPALAAGVIYAEDLLSTHYSCSGPIHHNASDGPEVIQDKDYNCLSGNKYTDKSFNLSTESNGWVNVSTSDADSSAMVAQIDEVNGSWTNASSITATSGNITFHPSDKNFTTVGDGITSIKFKDAKVDDGESDFIYSAGSSATVVVETNASDGTQYGAVNTETNEALDVGVADSDGTVAFTDLESGTNTVEVETLGNLTIREEASPHDKVTSATVTVRFYEETNDDPEIVERTASNGEVDLTGLPVDSEFAVTLNAPGFHNRTAILDDLSQQETVFMLNTSQTTVDNTFVIQDKSGNFPEGETELRIQKAINKSEYESSADGFEWVTIVGDNLGADQSLEATLENDGRYRIRVDNQDGDQRFLGSYNARSDGTIELTIGEVDLKVEADETYSYNATYNESGDEDIKFTYVDPNDDTTDLRLIIHEYNNASNEIVNTTSAGPFGTFTYTENLSASQTGTPWVVRFEATHASQGAISGERLVGADRADIGIPIDQEWREPIAIVLILVVAGLFGGVRVQAGMVVASFMSAIFWYLGFLPTSVSGGLVFGGLFLGILYTIGTSSGGEPVA